MDSISTYIDESGSIPKELDIRHRYFVIALVHVKNQTRATRIFKRSRLKAIKSDEKLFEQLKIEKEIKGSQLTEIQKCKIYEDLTRLCEDLEIGIVIMDTTKVESKFRLNKARCFNYLLSRYFITFSKKSKLYCRDNKCNLLIDEQNVATKSTHVLRGYINTELVMSASKYENDFSVEYYDSKNCMLIQLADFIANTTFRYLAGDSNAKKNMDILMPKVLGNDFFKFPM